VTAARRPGRIFAVAARGGRVDLAGADLRRVDTPVLLIAGGEDRDTLRRNNDAGEQLRQGAVTIRIPRAGNAFEEPGALGAVAEHTVGWLERLDMRYRRGDTPRA
jgi:pimeloyl-ACP methyl ester carboxylesterase